MIGIFLEVVMAPSFTEEALEILTEKQNIRLLQIRDMHSNSVMKKIVTVKGGILVQTEDDGQVTADDLTVVTDKHPTETEIEDLLFGWKAVKHVKSNRSEERRVGKESRSSRKSE